MKDMPAGQALWQEVAGRPEKKARWKDPDRHECLQGWGRQRVALSSGALSPTVVLPLKGPEP